MSFAKTTSAFILGTIAVIFCYDTLADVFGSHATISEEITNWINASTTNLIIFISAVLLISIHWIFGKYKDDGE